MPRFEGVAEVVGGGLPDSRVTRDSTALMVIDMQYLDAHRDHGLGARGQQNGWTAEMEYYFGRLESMVVPRSLPSRPRRASPTRANHRSSSTGTPRPQSTRLRLPRSASSCAPRGRPSAGWTRSDTSGGVMFHLTEKEGGS